MFKNKTDLKQALLMVALVTLLPFAATSQQVTVNKVYDFSGNADTLNSQINYVYADSNQIIALGEAYPDSAQPYAFTAAFDYSGNLLWEKPIRLPDGLYPMDSGFNNLVKVKPGLYVAGGNIANAPKEGAYVSKEPFLYFFNNQGDSIRLLRIADSMMDHRLSALTVNQEGHIIVGGSKVPLDSPLTHRWYGNYWLAEIANTGNVITEKLIEGDGYVYSFFPSPNAGITNIIPVDWDSIHYVLAINSNSPDLCGKIFWLDSTFTPAYRFLHLAGIPPDVPYEGDTYITMPDQFYHFEFNLILRKNHPYSFFWSFPVSIDYHYTPGYLENIPSINGLYFCRAHIMPLNIYTVDYHLDWYKAFLNDTDLMPELSSFVWKAQDRSELAEAVNGDLLVQREVYRPTDTVDLFPYPPRYYFPVLFRAGDTGHLKWGMSFQYVHTMDTGIYHNFYDISVAPDGRIVMAGFLRSRYAVPGYDSVGKVSWLVVLSDTLHDHQPQPPETEGIALTATGQQAKLLVYPNPTLDNTNIDLKHFKGQPQDFEWQLSDITGRLLQSGRLYARKQSIRLERYPTGVYLLRLNYKGQPAAAVKVLKE